jgi:hypothetical protein
LKNQTWSNWQSIVKDGGTEGADLLLAEFWSGDARASWQSKHDDGIYDAMNEAWALAYGDLTIFINSSDTFYDCNVLLQIARSYCLYRWDWACGRVFLSTPSNSRHKIFHPPKDLRRILYARSEFPHQGVVVRTKMRESIGYFERSLSVFADQQWCVRAYNQRPFFDLGFTVANFAAGGTSGRVSLKSREIEYHYLRKSTGHCFLGSRELDVAVGFLLYLWRLTKRALADSFFE